MKLVDIVNELPRALAHRFDSSFWVNNANKVLQDLELKGDIPRVKDTHYLPIEEGVCSYKLPSFIKKVMNVLPSNFASGFSLRQNRIILDIPDVLEGFTGNSSVLSQSGEQIQIEILGIDKPATPMYRDLILRDSVSGVTYAIQKLRFGDEETLIGENRYLLLDTEPRDLNSILTLTDLFVPIEYIKSFQQVEDMLEDILEDTDIHRVLQEGLWYFALRHISPDGAEDGTSNKRAEYELEKRRWFNRSTRNMFKQNTRFSV